MPGRRHHVTWPDEVDQVLDGDLTTALAYMTPTGGSW